MTESKFVDIDGKKVHYFTSIIEGARDTLIFLHGKSFKAETWISISADKKINDMKINFIAVDFPGWGLSEKNDKFWPPTGLYDNTAQFIRDFTDSLGIGKFSLLGSSFSGPFVISFAHKYPDRINKLILVGAVWSDELSDEVKGIDKQSLIIYGEKDVMSPDVARKYRENLKRNKFFTVGGAGHALYLDKPDEFFRILKGFL